MSLEFEWDDAKAARNDAKHAVSFEAACELSAEWSHFDFGIMAPPELRRNGASRFST